MAVKVGVSGTTVGTVKAAGSLTQVKKIVIGTPVKRVSQQNQAISLLSGGISDIDTTGVVDGSALIFAEASLKFIVQKTMNKTNITGGQY